MLDKLSQGRQSAAEAEVNLQKPDKIQYRPYESAFNDHENSEVVVDDTSKLDAYPKGGNHISKSIADVI